MSFRLLKTISLIIPIFTLGYYSNLPYNQLNGPGLTFVLLAISGLLIHGQFCIEDRISDLEDKFFEEEK